MYTKTPKIILYFVIFTILLQNSRRAFADEELIEKLCNSTVLITGCLDCLNSDPTSKTASDTGIVLTVINCATEGFNIIVKDAGFVFRRVTDPVLKDALDECVILVDKAQASVSSVSDRVKRHDFNGAKGIISDQILVLMDSCTKIAIGKGVVFPKLVVDDLNLIYKDWAGMVIRMLDSL